MTIHVVRSGETLDSIAALYGVDPALLGSANDVPAGGALAVGQALVVQIVRTFHVVQPGETLSAVARRYGRTLRALYRDNPWLGGEPAVQPGQRLVIAYADEKLGGTYTNGYAYPFIQRALLSATLPYMSQLTPFTYGFTPTGELVVPDDTRLIAAARSRGVASLMHLSTLTEEGGFSNELAHLILNDRSLQEKVTNNIITTLREKGYRGLDVDFEYVFAEDAAAYADFLASLTQRLNPLGYPVIAALAPKVSADQRGALYEGHDFAAIGAAVNEVLLMTYGWYILTHRPKSIDITGFERCLQS